MTDINCFLFFLVNGRASFQLFKKAGRHQKGAGRCTLQKRPRQNTGYVHIYTCIFNSITLFQTQQGAYICHTSSILQTCSINTFLEYVCSHQPTLFDLHKLRLHTDFKPGRTSTLGVIAELIAELKYNLGNI